MRALVAEFLGMFTLVFAGCGAIMVDATTHQLGHLGVAASFGLVIMVMIYAVGHISGAHFNPAVTAGFALARQFPMGRVPAYWAAQILGGVAAAMVLQATLGDVAGLGTTTPAGSDLQSFVFELLMTFLLMFVIMAVATDTRAIGEAAALPIGATVGLDALFGGPVSGASMNPARSLGPALVSGHFDGLWIYIAAPITGALFAAAGYAWLRETRPRPAQGTPPARVRPDGLP